MVISGALLALSILGLLCAPWPALGWRGVLIVLTLVLAWSPLRAIVWGRGPGAIRHVKWNPEGTWRISNGQDDAWEEVEWMSGSARLGPLVFMIWRQQHLRRYAVLDSACAHPHTFRTLCTRLRLEQP
jgi:hypothetical protein